MATLDLSCYSANGSGFKNNAQLRITYTALNGTLTITEIAARRTDGYRSYDKNDTTITVNIGGVSKSMSLSHYVDFKANSWVNWQAADTSWAGLTGSSISITVTMPSSSTAFSNATFKGNAAMEWSAYTVSYNANGGTGAPSAQTKTYGKALTLSSTKPTRTGYSFKGWATSASGAVVYASSASYTANAAITLYAVWEANTYTVTYNANGGTGAPSAQTKTYGKALTLSSTKPTRENYNFLGWGTSAASTTVAYAAGANYTINAAITLYAVWELAYIKPRISGLLYSRCNSEGEAANDGTNALVSFNWESDLQISVITIEWKTASATDYAAADVKTVAASGTSGTVNTIIGAGTISADKTYTLRITVTDSGGSSYKISTLSGSVQHIDFLAPEKEGDKGGAAIGKPAELQGVFDVGYQANFNGAVYGRALGMDRLPAIPESSDFNDYITTGCYAVHSNAVAATCSNMPVERAGRLEVWAATGEGVRTEQWSYLRQRFIPYNSENAVWERDITRGEDNSWRFYEWYRSSLTPAVSKKVYSKATIMLGLNANSTMSVASTYTKIPFDLAIIKLNDRLTLSENCVRIGADIDYIKVSANILLKCGAATTRHFRIQKISNGTTTNYAWTVLNATAGSNTAYIFSPVIIPVKEGDLISIVYYTTDTTDYVVSGSSANGRQSYLTVEEL